MVKMKMPKLASVRGQTLLTDTKPYLFRQSPVVAEMLDDMLTGGTVAWNQLARELAGNFYLFDNCTGTFSDGVVTFTAERSQARIATKTGYGLSYIPNHVYRVSLKAKNGASANRTMQFQLDISGGYFLKDMATLPPSSDFRTVTAIIKPTTGASLATGNWVAYSFIDSQNGEQFAFSDIQIFDLTLMFGSTIADYVYSLEQQTAGDGIAWLKSFGFFTKDYYPYDSGSLLSVKTSAHETVKGGITHTYPLSDIELRGIPKLQDGQLVYDGDVYESSGQVTRKYGIRAYQAGDESDSTVITDMTNTVYPLVTPTSETTDPFTNPQQAGTTEEYIDARTVPMPVGHVTQYFNMEQMEKIQMHMGQAQAIKMHMPKGE